MIESTQTSFYIEKKSKLSIRPLKIASWLLLFTLLLLPLHTQVFYYFLPLATGIPQIFMAIWKELALLVAGFFLLVLFALKGQTVHLIFCDLIATLFMAYILFLFMLTPDKGLGLYAVRVYAEPLFVYYLARSISLEYNDLIKFFRYLFILTTIISIWAIFQAAILGDDFLVNLGYRASPSGQLASGFYIALFFFQRAVGTFSSPNTFGIFLQMVILIGMFLWYAGAFKSKKWFFFFLTILVIALIYSFSRSAWLATFASVGIFILAFWDWKKIFRVALRTSVALFGIIMLIWFSKPELVIPVATHIGNTITLEDPSTMGHIDSLIDSLAIVVDNPLGMGLGLSGPRAIAQSDQAINAESSLFVLAFDVGIPGLILYGLFLLAIVMNLLNARQKQTIPKTKAISMTVIAIFLGQMIAWNLLPFIIELETTLLLFALLGIAHNLQRKDHSTGNDSTHATRLQIN